MRKKKQTNKKVSVTVMFPADEVEKIDRVCKKLSISRSAMVRNLVTASLDDLGIFESVGAIDILAAYRNKKDKKIGMLAPNPVG